MGSAWAVREKEHLECLIGKLWFPLSFLND
jgi:hypothetical protein